MVSEMRTEYELYSSTNVHHTVVLHGLPTGILVLCGLSRCLATFYPPEFFLIKNLLESTA
jgi:hypothetical protein